VFYGQWGSALAWLLTRVDNNGNGNNGNGNNNNSENGTIKINQMCRDANDAGDSLSLIVTGQNLDLGGKVIDSFTATINAARVQVEPL